MPEKISAGKALETAPDNDDAFAVLAALIQAPPRGYAFRVVAGVVELVRPNGSVALQARPNDRDPEAVARLYETIRAAGWPVEVPCA